MKGYIQVYTGDSKGKTTASLGLAIRAAGAGLKVIEKADLVTEMREIKHYYKQGVKARTGIEK